MNKHIAKFEMTPWYPLTDLPSKNHNTSKPTPTQKQSEENNKALSKATVNSNVNLLLFDILCYMFSSVRERIARLKISARIFENAKHELVTNNKIIEDTIGKTKYLIPKPEAFDNFNMPCPYKNIQFILHSFYMCAVEFSLKQNPACKSITLEYKISTSGHNADVVTQNRDGTLTAFEITLSLSNIIQNCMKYDNTGFTKIVFLCQNYDLTRAVKSKIFKAGLPLELLGKLEIKPLSSILKNKKSKIN